MEKESFEENPRVLLFEQHPKAKGDIMLLGTILLPMEMWVLKNFLNKQCPLSPRDLYKGAIIQIYNVNFSRSDKEKIRNNPIHKHLFVAYGVHFFIPEIQRKERLFFLKSALNKSSTDHIRTIEKLLRKNKVKFPTYSKIVNVLSAFESLGILIKRRSSDKKSDFYWIINPNFYVEFKDKFKEIMDL